MPNLVQLKIIAFTCIVLIIISCNFQSKKRSLEGNVSIPEFDMLLVDSTTYFNTQNIPTGRPVVLFYFGPYCDHSRTQMKNIIKNIENLKNIRFYLITQEPFNDMVYFYNNFRLNQYNNIVVGFDYEKFFNKKLKVQGYPYLLVYGKDGKLRNIFRGEVYGREILKSVTI